MPFVPKQEPQRHYIVGISPKVSCIHSSLQRPWTLHTHSLFPDSSPISFSTRLTKGPTMERSRKFLLRCIRTQLLSGSPHGSGNRANARIRSDDWRVQLLYSGLSNITWMKLLKTNHSLTTEPLIKPLCRGSCVAQSAESQTQFQLRS